MAKLKKAPGRIIGRWKTEAITANPGASDEDLAQIINDRARKDGYDYTIRPEKVRAKAKKKRKRGRKAAPAAAAARITPAPKPKPAARDAIDWEDIRALRGLLDRIGADRLQELAGMLSREGRARANPVR